jgi:ketosteroid isomerase-like protein
VVATDLGVGAVRRPPARDTERAMSQENVEVVRRVYDAFNRGDFASAVEYLHPAGEVYPGVVGLDPPGGGSATRLVGRDELRGFFEDLGATWESISIEPKEIIEAPYGRVLAIESWLIRGRDGIEVDTRIIDVYAFRDGLIARVDGYLDRLEALEAVGLSE